MLLKFFSPTPINAGKLSSEHLIAIWELSPPYLVIKPLILLLNISGLVISRLIGILTLTFSYVLPMNKQKEGFIVELSNKDLENIRLLIRYEVAQIMFDLYRKRKVWGA